jgi:hypothetical protein
MKTSTKTEPKTDIEVKLEAIEKMFKSFAGRMDRFQEKVRAYDPSNMLLMEKRHKELSERLQLLIQKITVITEVGHHTRNAKGLSESQRAAILDAAVRAFDHDDDWWKKYDWNRYDTLTVKQWAKMFLDTH